MVSLVWKLVRAFKSTERKTLRYASGTFSAHLQFLVDIVQVCWCCLSSGQMSISARLGEYPSKCNFYYFNRNSVQFQFLAMFPHLLYVMFGQLVKKGDLLILKSNIYIPYLWTSFNTSLSYISLCSGCWNNNLVLQLSRGAFIFIHGKSFYPYHQKQHICVLVQKHDLNFQL